MPYDPFSNLTNPYALAFGQQQRQPNPIQPFSPQEENSALGNVLGSVAGGIGAIGSALDKITGARAFRGLLGGNPRELLSPIPFSDTLGITDESQRLSGEDLLKKAGVLQGEGEKGSLEFRDFLGPAAEILLDPLTYATFGASALSKSGQIAKAIGHEAPTAAARVGTTLQGVLDKAPELLGKSTAEAMADATKFAAKKGWTLGEHLNEPLGGLMGLGMPFANPSTVFGGPEALQKIGTMAGAVRGLPVIKQASDFLEPPLTKAYQGLRGLFDPKVMGQVQPEAQAVAAEIARQQAIRQPAIRNLVANVGNMLSPEEINSQALRYAREGSVVPTTPRLAKAVTVVKQAWKDSYNRLHEWMDNQHLDDYFYRQLMPIPGQQYQKGFRGKALMDVSAPGREDILRVPGQTKTLQDIFDAADPATGKRLYAGKDRALNELQAENDIYQKFLGGNEAERVKLKDLLQNEKGSLPPEHPLFNESQRLGELNDLKKQAKSLADWYGSMSPERLQTGLWNNPMKDLESGLMRANSREAVAKVAQHTFANVATFGQAAEDDVPLAKALENVGLKDTRFKDAESSSAVSKQLELLAGQPHNQEWLSNQMRGEGAKTLDGWYVPKRIVDDLTRHTRPYDSPDALKPFLSWLDSITNLTKAGQTAFWPAKYARDFITGAYQNFVHGALSPSATLDAEKLLRTGKLENVAKYGVKDVDELNQLLFAHNIGNQGGIHRQIIGGEDAAQSFAERLGTGGRKIVPDKLSWNPLDIGGVGGRTETTFAPAAVGYNVGNRVFDVNETAAFLAKLEEGYSPLGAAKVAKAAQYNWGPGSLTQFEQSVMRRVVPFYSWLRQNVPAQVQQLIEHPGGITAQTIRTQGDLRQKGGFLPEYLESTLAIPIGREEGGTQRYVSSTGLPFEDLGEFVGRGPNRAADVGLGLLGQTNPLLKAPLEMATGKQFFSGRELGDLYSRTGMGTTADELIQNSPIGRAMNAFGPGGTLWDERKGALAKASNLLTGFKVSDVDMEKQRNQEARRVIDELLSGMPEVSRIQRMQVRKGEEGNLSPEEIALLRLQATLEKDARERAKKK